MHVAKLCRDTGKIGEELFYALVLDFFREEVSFVEKQNYGHTAKAPVVDDGVKDVYALYEPIRDSVFK